MPGVLVRKRVRLRGFDYASPGAYFITICTHRRACLFGEVHEGHVHLSLPGDIVRTVWQGLPVHFPDMDVDAMVVMPNHLHAILVLQPFVGAEHPELPDASPLPVPNRAHGTRPGSIPSIVQNAKSVSARRINLLRGTPGAAVWQRGYFEHVIRTQEDLDRLRRYIESNSLRWALNRENPDNA
jgi:REP element-mobilizing transposase RayT